MACGARRRLTELPPELIVLDFNLNIVHDVKMINKMIVGIAMN